MSGETKNSLELNFVKVCFPSGPVLAGGGLMTILFSVEVN